MAVGERDKRGSGHSDSGPVEEAEAAEPHPSTSGGIRGPGTCRTNWSGSLRRPGASRKAW